MNTEEKTELKKDFAPPTDTDEVENETDLDDQAEANEAKEETVTPPEKQGFFKRHGKASLAIACAVAFIIIYTIVNISVIAGFFSSVLSVLTPIILGGALAYILNPILKFFEYKVFKKIEKKSVVRTLSLVMTYVVALGIIALFCVLLIPQLIQSIVDFVNKFDFYMTTTANVINNFVMTIMDDHDMDDIVSKETIISVISNFLSGSGDMFSTVMDYVVQYGAGLIISIKNILLAIFISIYALASKERLKAQTKKFTTALFPPKGRHRFYRYVRLCNRTFGGYFMGMLLDSLLIGLITLIVLLIFRMPYALLISTIVCVTNIIPVFGPFIGAIPSFFIIFIVSPSKALIFLILILLIQQLDGNVIAPKILGDSTGLSSLAVIIAIVIMGEYFGIVGMIVGVPIFAIIVTIVKEFLEQKLRSKELPTDTAEYYAWDSFVDPHEVHETIIQRIAKNIKQIFSKAKAKINKSVYDAPDKKKNKNEKED